MMVTGFRRWDSFLGRVRVRVLGRFYIVTTGSAGILPVILNDLYIFPGFLERHVLKSEEIKNLSFIIYSI